MHAASKDKCAAELCDGYDSLGFGHPHLFWLSCVCSQSSLNGQLAVVHRHLRGQTSQLVWTCHWLGHLGDKTHTHTHHQSRQTYFITHRLVWVWFMWHFWKTFHIKKLFTSHGKRFQNSLTMLTIILMAYHFLSSDSNGLRVFHHAGLVIHKWAVRFRRRTFIQLRNDKHTHTQAHTRTHTELKRHFHLRRDWFVLRLQKVQTSSNTKTINHLSL